MFNTIINQLNNIAHSRSYWLLYIFSGVALLLAALFYQYILDQPPCVYCIQVRLWITLLVFVSIAGLLVRKNRLMNIITSFSVVLIAVALIERSYRLLGTERGFLFGDCGFDPGLPAWFAIDEWLPWLYRVETPCGYTPEIVFGITMAETLMVLSIGLLIVSSSATLASLIKN